MSRLPSALPFWLSLCLPPLAVLGMIFGGWMIALLPLSTWWLFTLLDALTSPNRENPDPQTDEARLTWHRAVTLVWFPVQFALLLAMLWYVPRAAHLGMGERIGLFFGMGVLSGTIGINYSHELMHQKSQLERWLGDLLLGGGPMTANHLRLMFCVCAGLGTINVLLALCATWHDDFQPRSRHASAWRLLRRYHPGTVLLVSSATGFGIGLPGTFLRPYAESMDIPGIALFFAVYCPTAFAARFLSRRLPARIGNRRVMHLGLGSMVLAMLLFTVAANQWLLCLPAVALGIAHALLFPSLIAAGTEAFPARNRGLATTLVLAFFDIGTLVGSPIAGGIVSYAGVVGLPPFGTMFVSVAAAIGLSALIYGASRTASASSSGAHSSATNENSLPTAHATQQASSRH